MTIPEPELWALLTTIMALLTIIAVLTTARYYQALTDIPEVNNSKYIDLWSKLTFLVLLAPSIMGLGICVIKTISLN